MKPQGETTPEINDHGPNFIKNDVKFSKKGLLIFSGVFAAIGATLAYILIFAAGNLPNSADEFVVRLEQEQPAVLTQEDGEVKNPHAEFKTLILGDGSLYCSDINDGNVQYREGKVTRGEIQSLVQTLKSNGISGQPDEDQETHVGELTRITVNYGNEVVTREVYSEEKPQAFQNAEARILESCEEATKVVDALPEYNSGLKNVPYEDPEDIDVTDTDDFPELKDVDEFESHNSEEQEVSLGESIKNAVKEQVAPEVYAGSYNTHYDLVHHWRINKERRSHSLNRLPKSYCLSVVAKRWSRYMAQNNTLKHNPNFGNDIDRYCGTSNGTWRYAGENVGVGWSESSLFDAFLRSCGHEANINSRKGCGGSYGSRPWTYTGIGFYVNNNGKMFVTQVFADCKSCNGPWLPKASFRLKNALSGGSSANYYAEYGRRGYTPLTCDWNKNGRDTIGVTRNARFYLRNSSSTGGTHHYFIYGRSGDVPLCGDWNGNGQDTIAVKRGSKYYIDYWLNGGRANKSFYYGRSTDTPIVGDWNGNGQDTIAVKRGNTYYIDYWLNGGRANKSFKYGRSTDTPIVGDWNGNGHDTIAVKRGNTYYIDYWLNGGRANKSFRFYRSSDTPVSGDWNGDGKDSLGIFRTSYY